MAKKHFIVLALYLVIALAMTYPLALNFGDHVPGSESWGFDEFTFLWNFWWFKHAVLNLGANPLHTNFTFYPIGNGLVTYTYTLLNAILAIPIELVWGYPAASNSILLFAITASAFGTFLLTGYLLRNSARLRDAGPLLLTLAAFTGGAVYAFASSRFVYASLGHYNFASSHYLPFYALFFIKTIRGRAGKNVWLAALFAAFAILTETTYAVFIALFSLVYLLFAWRAREMAPRLLPRLAVLGVLTALFAAPLLAPSLLEFANADYQLPAWGHAEKLLVDLFGLFTPTSLHPLNRNWVAELDAVRQGTSRFVDVNTVFLGYATLALASLGAWACRKTLAAWIASAVAFAILSFGPLLHINGQSRFDADGIPVTFPMPFLLLHYIPFLKENRVPNRFGILVMLALAVLTAFAVAWLSQKLKVKNPKLELILPLALLFLILFEHASFPLPLSDARVPDVYAQIAREPGDFAILTLPFGLRNSFGTLGAEDTRTQYYQSVHGKFLLSGNTSRNPPIQFEYFDRLSVFHSLAQVQLYNPIPSDVMARDKAQAAQLAALFNIRYVVVNAATPNRVPYSDTRDATVNYVRQVFPLGEKMYDREGVIAYRVIQPPLASKAQIKFGTDAALPFQAEGWEGEETIANELANWVSRREARLLIPTRDAADYMLTLRGLPFTYPNAPAQTMDVVVNGQSVQRVEMKPGWGNYSVTLPARALRSGVNDIVLKFGYAVRPRDVSPAHFAVGSTGAISPVNITAQGGELGSIRVNAREASKLGRGYNIVWLDARGDVMDARSFNTADEANASRALADFIAKIPSGSIVAAASQEEIAGNLSDGAMNALKSIGAQSDPRQNPNRAQVIIGVKGAASGSALEQGNEGGAFIFVGQVPDDRTLAAAISLMTIEKK